MRYGQIVMGPAGSGKVREKLCNIKSSSHHYYYTVKQIVETPLKGGTREWADATPNGILYNMTLTWCNTNLHIASYCSVIDETWLKSQ